GSGRDQEIVGKRRAGRREAAGHDPRVRVRIAVAVARPSDRVAARRLVRDRGVALDSLPGLVDDRGAERPAEAAEAPDQEVAAIGGRALIGLPDDGEGGALAAGDGDG